MNDGADCDVLIVGAGPGGYVCALRAAQLGLKVVIVERAEIGGTCLNIGCIPSKAIIHAADEYAAAGGREHLGITTDAARIDLAVTMGWKDGVVHRLTGGVATLLDHGGVRRIAGEAQIVDGKTVRVGDEMITTDHLVLATGSEPIALPHLPFGGRVLSSTGALSLTEVPGRLVVVGAGYIGLELGTAYRKLGSEVTVVELQSRILPQYDEVLSRPVSARLKALGVTVHLGATAGGLKQEDSDGGGLTFTDADGVEHTLAADAVLVTVGRRPVTAGIESLHLAMDGRVVHVDDQCRTSMRAVFAIGDLTGEPMLAHRAMAQGALVAEVIAGLPRGGTTGSCPRCASPIRRSSRSGCHRRRPRRRASTTSSAASRWGPTAGRSRSTAPTGSCASSPGAPITSCWACRPSAPASASWRRRSPRRSRWAPCSRTSPPPSTPTRRSAKPCRKPRSRRSAGPSTAPERAVSPSRDASPACRCDPRHRA